jgi:hypothetical protein
VRPHGFRNRFAIVKAQPLVETRAEAAGLQPLVAEKRTLGVRTGVRQVENLQEQIAISLVAAHREPLHFVLVFVGRKPQQFGHPPVEIAQRIRRVVFLIERHDGALGVPARAAPEIAAAVERQHRGPLERRRVIRRGGVR